ncbi:unnamed protein product [Aureobasidium pullulans]|nr:unnamed protein product [Aureobasidium pullulans]
MAISIQRAAGSEAGLGRKWLYKFLEKYSTCGSLLGDPHEALRVNEATEENPTKKKDFCRLYHEARKETFKPSNYETAFKKAGLVPFDPQSVINRPEVIKQPPQPREPQPDDLPPCIYDAKALEKDLYHLDKERGACDTHGED